MRRALWVAVVSPGLKSRRYNPASLLPRPPLVAGASSLQPPGSSLPRSASSRLPTAC